MKLKTARPRARTTRISYLASHDQPYCTVGDLAEYWQVSRKQIYKQIEAGALPAIRLGPRLFRISTDQARDFEERAKLAPSSD